MMSRLLRLCEEGIITDVYLTYKKNLEFRGNKKAHKILWASLCGARGRIRTSDHLVRSQVLYPAEIHALKLFALKV
jgi:hypothetical protein